MEFLTLIIAHYDHRLPVNHDISLIRTRVKERGPLWDAVPELYFKGFLLREQGRYGAIANNYSSLYLWRQDRAFRDFLVTGRYKIVTDAFGRASIRTRVALDARRGRGRNARFVHLEEVGIPLDADLTMAFAHEIERNQEVANSSESVVAVVGVDTQNWRFTRIILSENELTGNEPATIYEILHLAKPLLETLTDGASAK